MLHNLRRYWKQHLLHVSIGIFAGVLLTNGYEVGGFALFLAQHIRQIGGFWQKKDSLSIDLFYCQGGLAGGLMGGLLL